MPGNNPCAGLDICGIAGHNARFPVINEFRSRDLANTPQAKKRARQAESHRRSNVAQRSRLRTHIKGVINALEAGDAETAQSAYKAAVPAIDAAVNRGLIHKNNAARNKSRLNSRVKALAGAG